MLLMMTGIDDESDATNWNLPMLIIINFIGLDS
jgi:hypothetical protein